MEAFGKKNALWQEYIKDEAILMQYESMITKENLNQILTIMYKYIKFISNKYYDTKNDSMSYIYDNLRYSLLCAGNKIRSIYWNRILDYKTIYNPNISIKDFEFVTYLVYLGRKYLIDKYKTATYKPTIQELDLTNNCLIASEYIKRVCDKYGVKSQIIKIYPGFSKNDELYNKCGYHCFNIMKYQGKRYLVDLTYSQFFYEHRNNLERIGVVDIFESDPGIFMTMDEKSKNIALKILQDGFIELDEEVLKRYLDAFTISFRNGLYYESTGDFSFETQYTFENYINFLVGNDNQVNYEGKENLGYQKRPLRNPLMSINKKI